MYGEFEPLDYVGRVEAQNENYTQFTYELIKNHPKKWLDSLPMYEYAHVQLVLTALRTGGNPQDFIDELYKLKIGPILKEYYEYLTEYRFHVALLKRNYTSLKHLITKHSVLDELKKMRKRAIKARKDIRQVCKEYENMKCGRPANFVRT